MNSVERFNAVLDGRKPDRMPLYIPTIACTVAEQILGHEAHTGGDSLHFKEEYSWTQGEQAHAEFVAKYREDTLELARVLEADVVREGWRCKRRPARRIDEHTLLFGDEAGLHTIKRYFPESQSYGTVFSNEGSDDADAYIAAIRSSLEEAPGMPATDEELARTYGDQLILKKQAGDGYAVIAGALSIGLPMESTVWLEATAMEPDLLGEYNLRQAQWMVGQVDWFRRQGFRFINAGADIAAQDGPVISPRAFARVAESALKVLAAECGRLGMTYCYRSDGNMWSLCDSIFTRAGVQAYGEVDRGATMTVGALHEKYPGLIVLGNVSSITLSQGTERQVREETRATLEESGGVGYIAGPSNAIVHGTPVGNVYAMVGEIKNYKP